jgi:phage terminase Nu1 subunit (DNA packaging protein)
MSALGEAEVRVISAAAHHRRLCEAYDRGEQVDVALKLAHTHLAAAKARLAELTKAAS